MIHAAQPVSTVRSHEKMITLGDRPTRTVLEFACERRGRLRPDKLIVRRVPDLPLSELRVLLAGVPEGPLYRSTTNARRLRN